MEDGLSPLDLLLYDVWIRGPRYECLISGPTLLHSDLAHWLEMPDSSVSHEAVFLYMHAIERWLSDQDIPVRPGPAVDALK